MSDTDIILLVHEEVAVPDASADSSRVSVVEAPRATKMRVDGNVIRDVHLVGLKTKNYVKPSTTPYEYQASALEAATAIYENVDIFVGHTKKDTPTIGTS